MKIKAQCCIQQTRSAIHNHSKEPKTRNTTRRFVNAFLDAQYMELAQRTNI